MTELKSDGGSAFPHMLKEPFGTTVHTRGMSLLDHFAGLAMQALIADGGQTETIAANAYQFADAMIQQRAYWIARRHKTEETP